MGKLDLNFQDEQGSNLSKFEFIKDDGSLEIGKLIRRANVTQRGTPLNAENMNKIVSAINSNYDYSHNALYELGVYDTYVYNDDGTYTITRQTGYHNISIDLIKNGAYRTTQAGHGEYGADTGIHNLPIISGSKNFINNLLTVRDNSELYVGSTGISISENGMCWVNLGDNYTTTEQYREYFAKNNIYVQYKLATATTEKVEEKHYARYNERFILDNNKYEAELSANLWDEITELGTISGTDGSLETNSERLRSKNFIPISPNTKYIFNKSYVSRLNFYDSSFNFISTLVYSNTSFVTPSNAVFMKFDINSDYGTTYNKDIILNKGDIILDYQPYYGKPVHKKEFEDFKNSMQFIPYVSMVETTSSKDISENGTYFVVPTDLSSASLKLQVKAGPRGTLQTAYFSGGIISVFSFYDSKLKTCGVQITYGAGSSIDATQIADSYSPAGSSSGIISRVTGKCKIYKLI